VVVTDGRATAGTDPVSRSREAAAFLASQSVASVVVDCETGRTRFGLARAVADHLGAEHVPLGKVSAQALTHIVRSTTREGAA
jgi:magnesium chelatase subunit D